MTGPPAPVGPGSLGPLAAYRDDGLLGRLIGRLVGGLLPVSPAVLTLAGALPLGAALGLVESRAGLGVLGVVLAWYLLLSGAAAARPPEARLGWLVPPMLRIVEYATLARLATIDVETLPPWVYALIAVLVFHHYDTVYRFDVPGLRPARALEDLGGGWALRLALAYAAVALGVLHDVGPYAAGVLALLFGGETIGARIRVNRTLKVSQP